MRISLRIKTSLFIAVAAILLSTISVVFYNNATLQFTVDMYSERATDLANTVAVSLDTGCVRRVRDQVLAAYEQAENKTSNDELGTPELDAYVAQFEHITQTEDYKYLLEQVREVQDKNNAECVYLLWPYGKDDIVLYLVDGSYEEQCLPGQFDYFTEHDHEVLENPHAGIPLDITHTVWGWNVAVGKPIYDSNEIVGYATDDFSMDDIMARQQGFLSTVIIAIAVVTLLLAIVAIVLVNRLLIAPIQVLTDASRAIMDEGIDVSHRSFADVHIHTHDEIETLADTMVQMEHEIKDYIQNLTSTSQELALTKTRAAEMNDLAIHDALTGTFNKRAYGIESQLLDEQIECAHVKGTAMPNYGIAMVDLNYLKLINDTYGHEKGDEAIRAVVELIRSTFDDCAIYRIGGDEFAVLLRGDQCAHAEEFIARFKKALGECSPNAQRPWEHISAAIGYAPFDPGEDEDVNATLRQADKTMYAHKASMKAGRA